MLSSKEIQGKRFKEGSSLMDLQLFVPWIFHDTLLSSNESFVLARVTPYYHETIRSNIYTYIFWNDPRITQHVKSHRHIQIRVGGRVWLTGAILFGITHTRRTMADGVIPFPQGCLNMSLFSIVIHVRGF
jgi:hypothetical protein